MTVAENQSRGSSTFGRWMGSMWLYTILRFALFFALWGLMVLVGLHGLVGAFVALLLSVPLSFVLFAVPRARFAASVKDRLNARREPRQQLDDKLEPGADDEQA